MSDDTKVPNQRPQVDPGAVRLAIVGESPGVEEVSWATCASGHGFALQHWSNRQLVTRDRCCLCGTQSFKPTPRPFSGESGRLLDAILSDSGLPRERCWIGNVSRTPLNEDQKNLEYCGPVLSRLAIDLEEFKPTLVLCLGGLSLSAFKPPRFEPSPTKWRGSRFTGSLDGVDYECMAALHPAAILHEPSQLALLRFDIARAVSEATRPSPPLARTIHAFQDADAICAALSSLRLLRAPVGYDVEGDHKCVTVCSFAPLPTLALSIPLRAMDYSRLWSTTDEDRIMRAVGDVLEDAAVSKVCHNAAFETFVHRWLYGHRLRSPEDSMIAFNCMWPELDKNLSVAASILTMQPYWGETSDWRNQADRDTYNAIDSCVCLEAWQRLMAEFTPAQRTYYEIQRDLLAPCGEMSYEGMPFDAAARDALVDRIQQDVYAAQGALDQLAGITHPSYGEVAEAVAFKIKRDKCQTWSDLLTYAKPSMRENL
jgi:uracil-DNA glycosylase family 4